MQNEQAATSDHVAYCFDSLLAHFSGATVGTPAFADVLCPLFVTWNKLSRRGTYRLRGCIGTLEAKQLHQALRDYALTSALGDRRFAPVEQGEIPSLKCTVSLLRCFQQAANWLDWKVGQHGLIIEFTDPLVTCKRTATFLPEIPAQEGWSQQQTIDSLILKSGYTGAITAELRDTLGIVRYESTHVSLTYLEYEQHRLVVPMPQAVFA